ncbi:hypothetical protein ACWGRV_33285 [Streptomyces sp. NPDC055663]
MAFLDGLTNQLLTDPDAPSLDDARRLAGHQLARSRLPQHPPLPTPPPTPAQPGHPPPPRITSPLTPTTNT